MKDTKQIRLFIPYTTAGGWHLAACFDHSFSHLQAVCARKMFKLFIYMFMQGMTSQYSA
jgi:hypothetical protein